MNLRIWNYRERRSEPLAVSRRQPVQIVSLSSSLLAELDIVLQRALVLLLCVASASHTLSAAPADSVAARVNGQEITVTEVDAALAAALRQREADAAFRPKLQAETLAPLIDR